MSSITRGHITGRRMPLLRLVSSRITFVMFCSVWIAADVFSLIQSMADITLSGVSEQWQQILLWIRRRKAYLAQAHGSDKNRNLVFGPDGQVGCGRECHAVLACPRISERLPVLQGQQHDVQTQNGLCVVFPRISARRRHRLTKALYVVVATPCPIHPLSKRI